jgi:pseudouridine synthase
MALERLQKYIAHQGVASRRKAEDLIRGGKVMVNGKRAEIGMKIDSEKDKVVIKDQKLQTKSTEPVAFIFNKPKGITSTTRKFKGEKNILSFFPDTYRLYPAGRLDKESHGMMILTNDGDLANDIMHPSKKSEKEYIVTTYEPLTELHMKRLKQGITYEKVNYKTISAREIKQRQYRIVLGEGKKRHIRMMFRALRIDIKDLFRKRINSLEMGRLANGKYKKLSDEEIELLLQSRRK